MLTFTVGGRGRGAYTKLGIINEVKSYVTYLIANSKSNIYFFSNIEVGHSLSNPHLHTQVWFDDLDEIKRIRNKVIKKFNLVKKRCDLTLPHETSPQQPQKHYNYVLKDYAKDLSDKDLWNLEQTKKRMRNKIVIKDGLKHKLNIRFISKSKGKYTKKLYKKVYHAFGVLRNLADKFLDTIGQFLTIDSKNKEYILYVNKSLKSYSISSFITIENKEIILSMTYIKILIIGLDVLFYSPAMSPPFAFFYLIVCILKIKGFFMEQFFIAITGVVAIWLTQQEVNSAWKKYASIFGLLGQPFWFYSAYTNEQWGIFALSLFYTYSWYVGFRNNFLKQ